MPRLSGIARPRLAGADPADAIADCWADMRLWPSGSPADTAGPPLGVARITATTPSPSARMSLSDLPDLLFDLPSGDHRSAGGLANCGNPSPPMLTAIGLLQDPQGQGEDFELGPAQRDNTCQEAVQSTVGSSEEKRSVLVHCLGYAAERGGSCDRLDRLAERG